MPKEIKTFKIAMLGAGGVGKTSLLTAMYEQFENTIGQTSLQLIPDLETSAILQKRLGELKSLLDEFNTHPGKFAKNVTDRTFIFDLAEKGNQSSLRLQFKDYPGEYSDHNSTINQKEFVKNLVIEADAVIIAIDTPAMMEKNGKYHDMINRPQQITDLFKMIYKNMKSPKLVIFAPVRCETYLKDEELANILAKTIKNKYANLLSLFASDALLPWVVNIVTPVQTLGNVVFGNIEVQNNIPIFHFRKTSHEAKYNPKDSDQPLRYLLRFMLKLEIERRNWGVFSFIRGWFGWDEHIKKSARQAAQGCKSNHGFAVLQGEKWLNIE